MTDRFAGRVAARYDADTADLPVQPVVDFLEPLAGGGALELGVGAGRIAVPLARRGVRVASGCRAATGSSSSTRRPSTWASTSTTSSPRS